MKRFQRIQILLLAAFSLWMAAPMYGQGSSRKAKFELLREIDLEEGQARLESFRRLWIQEDYSFKFQLEYIPRRGKREKTFGTLWGASRPEGAITLIKLDDELEQELYLKNGVDASIAVRNKPEMKWAQASDADSVVEVARHLIVTPFDLLMPYVYWDEWSYEGVLKIRGRIAHTFLMKVPSGYSQLENPLKGVIIYLDEKFNALLKAEYVDASGKVVKSFRLLDLKKVQDVWIPKTFEIKDELSGNKTRFRVNSAAMHQNFSDHALGAGELPDISPSIAEETYQYVKR